LNVNDVVQSDGLIHGSQIVEAVGSEGTDAQAEVDLGEGSYGDGHGKMILTTGEPGKQRLAPSDFSYPYDRQKSGGRL
jgi:hypothetical protein